MYRSKIELHNVDCLPFMKQCDDKQFDLAIVDPPYGINYHKEQKKGGKGRVNFKQVKWDNEIPPVEYWNELFRISKNQIVWGGNYMTKYLEPSRCWISWYKMQEFSTNEFELAWTSFDRTCKQFNLSRVQAYAGKNKIHPTEKPIKLYEWLLHNFAKKGDKIFDSHIGSGSIAIACDKMEFDLVGTEIDSDYFRKASKRLDVYRRQQTLF